MAENRIPQEIPLDVIERENNGSTSPSADQTNPWFDRPKSVDSVEAAPARNPGKVTGVPFEGEKMPKRPKAEPSGEPTLLNWTGKKGPLN